MTPYQKRRPADGEYTHDGDEHGDHLQVQRVDAAAGRPARQLRPPHHHPPARLLMGSNQGDDHQHVTGNDQHHYAQHQTRVQVRERLVLRLRPAEVEETPRPGELENVPSEPEYRHQGTGKRHRPATGHGAAVVVGVDPRVVVERIANGDVALDRHGSDQQRGGHPGERQHEAEVVAERAPAQPVQVVLVDGDDHGRGGDDAQHVRESKRQHQAVEHALVRAVPGAT